MTLKDNGGASLAADATGAAVYVWSMRVPLMVRQVSVRATTTAAAPMAEVDRINGDGQMIYVTPVVPTGDAVGGDPPLPLDPDQQLQVAMSGLNPGDPVTVLIIYDDQVS